MTLLAESDSESTTLYAEVHLLSNAAASLRIAVLVPRWEYRSLLGKSQSAGLFIEPTTSRPMAISTQRGMLWCIPHNGSAKVLSAA